jgi:hypothetical protein
VNDNFVFYTVTTGMTGIWGQVTRMLIDTLRKFGNYDGPVVVFGDGELNMKGVECVDIKEVFEHALHGAAAVTNIHACRISGAQWLLKRGYESMFYCDADSLICNPLDDLIEVAKKGKIVANGDCAEVEGTLAVQSRWHNGFMRSAAEWQLCKKLGMTTLNSGTFLGSLPALDDLLDSWWDIWKNGYFAADGSQRCREQAAFNCWCLYNFEKVEILPPLWIHCHILGTWLKPPPATKVLHFFGDNIRLIPPYYERMTGGMG